MIFLKRFYAVFKARNLEFFRDRSSLTWAIVFPIVLLVGFAVVFSGDGQDMFKAGMVNSTEQSVEFTNTKYVEFVEYKSVETSLEKLRQHKVDIVLDVPSQTYWINETSPNGYMIEKVLLHSDQQDWKKQLVSGKQIRYLDWVLPGILGMNMMFSCLFGVGYVIVRYRKAMVLKRLNATPISSFEFLLAQICSRLFVVMFLVSSVFTGCNFLFDFYMLGSYVDLFIVGVLGAMSLISLGLLVASRSRSEELTGGLLNLATWPMMLLSGVWFSLEGSPELIQQIAQVLPLTHLVDSARAIMTEGAGLVDIQLHLFVLGGMTIVFLGLGSWLFRWQGDSR